MKTDENIVYKICENEENYQNSNNADIEELLNEFENIEYKNEIDELYYSIEYYEKSYTVKELHQICEYYFLHGMKMEKGKKRRRILFMKLYCLRRMK